MFVMPTEAFGWIDLIEGFLQGAVIRAVDHVEIGCSSEALVAVDSLMSAARIFNMPSSRSAWPNNWTYVVPPFKATMDTFNALMVCNIGSAWWE